MASANVHVAIGGGVSGVAGGVSAALPPQSLALRRCRDSPGLYHVRVAATSGWDFHGLDVIVTSWYCIGLHAASRWYCSWCPGSVASRRCMGGATVADMCRHGRHVPLTLVYNRTNWVNVRHE